MLLLQRQLRAFNLPISKSYLQPILVIVNKSKTTIITNNVTTIVTSIRGHLRVHLIMGMEVVSNRDSPTTNSKTTTTRTKHNQQIIKQNISKQGEPIQVITHRMILQLIRVADAANLTVAPITTITTLAKLNPHTTIITKNTTTTSNTTSSILISSTTKNTTTHLLAAQVKRTEVGITTKIKEAITTTSSPNSNSRTITNQLISRQVMLMPILGCSSCKLQHNNNQYSSSRPPTSYSSSS